MFYFDPTHVTMYDLTAAPRFVSFWQQFYTYKVKALDSQDEIDYIRELNLGHHLTAENVRLLLRWKDPRYLTHRKVDGPNAGTDNPKVVTVLDRLSDLNAFRDDALTVERFMAITSEVFGTGYIWRWFLFHICRPHEYPIVDQHVLRVFGTHTGCWDDPTRAAYMNYKSYFFGIATQCGITDCNDREQYVSSLKQIDNALMSFGQFLKRYSRKKEVVSSPGTA